MFNPSNICIMKINFIKGKAVIKDGHRIIAKIYDRPEFFKQFPKITHSERYNLEMCIGSFQSNSLDEIDSKFLKYQNAHKSIV